MLPVCATAGQDGRGTRLSRANPRCRRPLARVPGFILYDIYRPKWLGETFDLIVCDPPFYNVSLSQLFIAIRTIARHDYSQPLLISYLTRRSENLLATFSPFKLVPTGYRPGYQTVQACQRNDIEIFGNLGAAWV